MNVKGFLRQGLSAKAEVGNDKVSEFFEVVVCMLLQYLEGIGIRLGDRM